MARRSDHSREELKEIILQISWDIIKNEGINNLTARRIAGEIGYTVGTIYNIFNSMDDLYLQINARTLELLYTTLASPVCINDKKSPVTNMKKMAEIYRNFTKEYRQHWLMLFTHTLPNSIETPEWYQNKIRNIFTPLETLLTPFYTDKQIRKRKMAARILWASVHGLCFLEETGKLSIVGEQIPARDMTDYLVDSFIAGIKK